MQLYMKCDKKEAGILEVFKIVTYIIQIWTAGALNWKWDCGGAWKIDLSIINVEDVEKMSIFNSSLNVS